MSVNLLEVMGAARARAASLVAEVSGYLVLGAADQVLGAPRALGAADVGLAQEGALFVVGGSAAGDSEAAASLRSLLARLLAVSASVTPALLRVSQREPGLGMAVLVRELEAALIPVNRAAARRAMSRLYRDVDRAKLSGRLAPAPVEDRVPIEALVVERPLPVETSLPIEPSLPVALLVTPLPEPIEPEPSEPALHVDVDEVEPWQEASPSLMLVVTDEPATAPEPVVTRRRTLPPPLPEVPDLDVPIPSPMPPELSVAPPVEACTATPATVQVYAQTPALGSPSSEAPLELREADVTDRAPELELEELGSSEYTPCLTDLVTAARLRPPVLFEDPDDLVIRAAPPPLEMTVPLPPAEPITVALPELPELPELPDYDPIRIEPQPAPVLAFDGPDAEDGAQEVGATPITPMPVVALERLNVPPPRPRVFVPAPPRYEPRHSDVDDLLSSFEVSDAAESRALCAGLKQLAGVDRTELPPAVSTATPPPVVVEDDRDAPRPAQKKSRIGLGALATLLAVGALGVVAKRVAVPAADTRVSMPGRCEATLAVSGIPSGFKAQVRDALEHVARSPTELERDQAIFTGLPCRQALEVTVSSDGSGRRSWTRIPVSAEAMTPSEEVPSEVRVALKVR